jgi:GNAT superfamily N-acetyltransferase
MSSISYRLATADDVQQLVELLILMQVEVNGLTNLDVTNTYLDKVIDYFENIIGTDKYSSIIALDGEYVIAAAGVCFYRKPPTIAGGSGLVGFVNNVYTRKDYRGQGVSTQLMKDLHELGRKNKVDVLHLGATPDGVNIYKSLGYEEPKFVNLEININKLKDSKGSF